MTAADATIVYYTSAREDPGFEGRVRDHVAEVSGGLPIISVSHKPIDFGRNICVGDVGQSNVNIFRQMLIGAEAAETKYIITAEADIIQPREFFEFRPAERGIVWLAHPMYVCNARLGKRRSYCLKAHGSEGAMVVERGMLLRNLAKMLRGQPEWADSGPDDIVIPFLLRMARWQTFALPAAVVSFRTNNQLHRATPWVQGSETRSIPYWGDAGSLVERFV